MVTQLLWKFAMSCMLYYFSAIVMLNEYIKDHREINEYLYEWTGTSVYMKYCPLCLYWSVTMCSFVDTRKFFFLILYTFTISVSSLFIYLSFCLLCSMHISHFFQRHTANAFRSGKRWSAVYALVVPHINIFLSIVGTTQS